MMWRNLQREVDAHIEEKALELIESGVPAREAWKQARREFGNSTLIIESSREVWRWAWLDRLHQDLRYAFSTIRHTPTFTIVAIVTLAIGIGANSAIFSLVNGVLIKPLPYPDSERLITVAHTAPGANIADIGSSPFLYFTEREQNSTLEGVGLWGFDTASVTGPGGAEEVGRFLVTSDVLPILGIEPLLGRYFVEEDAATGSPNAIILTYGYWQRQFGGVRSVIGQRLTMNGEAWEIVGVMPQRFIFPGGRMDVIIPYRLNRNQVVVGNFFWRSIARLRPGVTLEEASADVRRMIPIAIDTFPLSSGMTRERIENSRLDPNLRPLKQDVVGGVGNTLWVLMGTIGIVLLIACANLANFFLVRAEGRQHELSIRAALGAGWWRIARGLLTESIVISLAGAALGVTLAYITLPVLLANNPVDLPRTEEITVDHTVLLFALGLSIFAGLLFGLIPTVRLVKPRLATTLRARGRSSNESRPEVRSRGILVIVQVALALVLVIGGGLMIRTFQKLNEVDPGFTLADEIQTLQIQIPETAVPDPELTVRRQNEILNRIAALRGVSSVAYTSAVPLGGGYKTDLFVPEGKVLADGKTPEGRQLRFVSPDLFRTLGIALIAGRDITWTDIYERRPVLLVSENLARAEWGSPEEALGKRARGSSSEDQWREIVGVVGEVRDRGLSQPMTETVYVPALAERIDKKPLFVQRSVTYAVRSGRTGMPGFLEEIRQAVGAVDSNLPLTNVRTMGEFVSDSLARASFTLTILLLAGAMALLLGIIGIYGVVSYAVSRRRREIGIRLALGAQLGGVTIMFVRQALVFAGIGVAIGLTAAAGLTRLMTSLLFEVSPLDPTIYLAGAAVLSGAALLASYLPARRAATVDPVEALRSD